jgi:hypothetical protein
MEMIPPGLEDDKAEGNDEKPSHLNQRSRIPSEPKPAVFESKPATAEAIPTQKPIYEIASRKKSLCRRELLYGFAQLLRIAGVGGGDLRIHETGGEKLFDFRVEVLHSLRGAFLHGVQQVVA